MTGEIIVFGVFALGYNLLLGYGGEISFGHAAFFGLGAYGTILFTQYGIQNLYIGIVVGALVAGLVSIPFGLISLRRRGIYFAMITLALAQIVYYVSFQWTEVTGGDNGLSMPLFDTSLGPFDPAAGGPEFVIFGIIVFTAVWLMIDRIVSSPFGRALVAIRENEARAEHLGYQVNHFLFGSFIFSALFSGVAGGLYATLFGFVTPDLLFWLVSGEIVLVVLLGGIGTLSGSVIGAFVFISFQEVLTESGINDWRIIFGLIIMLVVLFAPTGIYGVYKQYRDGGRQPRHLRSVLNRLLE